MALLLKFGIAFYLVLMLQLSYCKAGAQPALHFGWGDFHELSFDDVIVLIQPWYNFFANGHR